MSTVKVIKDGPQFERELREWILTVKSASNRNKKAAFFVAQLSHLIAAAGGRHNFKLFQNSEFMKDIYDIFREALKCPQSARLDWDEIENYLDSVPETTSSKKRRGQDDGPPDDEGRPKRARISTRKEFDNSPNSLTSGGISTQKFQPNPQRGAAKKSRTNNDGTDKDDGDEVVTHSVSATQIMCYDTPCKYCFSNGLPCIVPKPNALACQMCRMRKTKCSRIVPDDLRTGAPTSRDSDEESDPEYVEVDRAANSKSQASSSRMGLDPQKKPGADEILKLRRQIEGLERQNKRLMDSVESIGSQNKHLANSVVSLTEIMLQSMSAQKEDIQRAADDVKGLKAKLHRGN